MELHNVSKSYKDHPIFLNANMRIEKGDFVYITGESGVGKSTLLHMLMGEIAPDTGNVRTCEGKDMATMSRKERSTYRKNCGCVYQDYQIIPYKNVSENIIFGMELTGYPTKEIEPRKNELLGQVHLTHKANSKPHELSGGELQRVAIARAIIHEPAYIFADEPTGNLDAKNRNTILGLLNQLHAQGATIVFATHDDSILSTTNHDVYVIDDLSIKKR